MKGNQILGIGLIFLSVTIIIDKLFKLPDILYLIFLSLAIILEIIGVVKTRKNK